MVGLAAAALLAGLPGTASVAAMLVLGAWLFDRADGQLARRQGTVSAWGAWFDANVDELLDIGWHVAAAAALARPFGATWPWLLVLAFVSGKYLFMHGLAAEVSVSGGASSQSHERSAPHGFLRTLWHLPGNADVRVHLLALALLTGTVAVELALIAAYYHLRGIARYVLVARRLGGAR